jgi:hypothetical protein
MNIVKDAHQAMQQVIMRLAVKKLIPLLWVEKIRQIQG